MIRIPLLKQTIVANYKLVAIFLAVLAMYFIIIASMFDPKATDGMTAMLEALPKEYVDAFGFTISDPTLIGFLAGYFYGYLIILFPMIYDCIVSNRLIAAHVNKGSMSYILSTPTTRKSVAATQALFLIGSVTLLIGFVTALGIFVCNHLFPGELDVPKFLLLNLGALLLHYALSGIGFFASCLFNDTKYSVAVGAGIPIAFLLIQMLANMGGDIENLKYATLLTLFNPTAIVDGASSVPPSFAALGILAAILYISGIYIFHKRDLPL